MNTNTHTGASVLQAAVVQLRRPTDHADLKLSTQAEALLSSLDESLRPADLAARHPRIVNQMARLWRRPMHLDRYFEELLIDSRGNRQGFPLTVIMELITVKQHYQHSTFPNAPSVWDAANTDQRHR